MVWVEEFLANEDVSYPCNPGMTNVSVACELVGANTTNPPSSDAIISDQFSCVLDNNPNLFTQLDLEVINQNPWMKKYINDFMAECGAIGDSDRPFLGFLSEMARLLIPDEESKVFWDWYNIGLHADFPMNQHMFDDIVANLPPIEDWIQSNSSDPRYNEYLINIPWGDKYGAALGQFTLVTDFNGNPIGLADTYDFDWKWSKFGNGSQFPPIGATGGLVSSICGFESSRGLFREWATRAASVAGWENPLSGGYSITYP